MDTKPRIPREERLRRLRVAVARWRTTEAGKAASARQAAKDKAAGFPRARRWYALNSEKHIAAVKRWRAAHPEQQAAIDCEKRAQKRAATRGTRAERMAVYLRAQSPAVIACHWCGRDTHRGEREVDHIVPLSRGGLHAPENMTIACARCNRSKHAKMPHEFHAAPRNGGATMIGEGV